MVPVDQAVQNLDTVRKQLIWMTQVDPDIVIRLLMGSFGNTVLYRLFCFIVYLQSFMPKVSRSGSIGFGFPVFQSAVALASFFFVSNIFPSRYFFMSIFSYL